VFARTRWHLVGWTMLVVALILVALGGLVYAFMYRSLLEQVDRNLASRAEQAAANPQAFLGGGGELEREGYRGGVFYMVVARNGRVIVNPQRVDLAGPDLTAVVIGQGTPMTVQLDDEATRLYALPLAGRARLIEKPGGPPDKGGPQGKPGPPLRPPAFEGATLVVGQSLAPEERAQQALLFTLGGGLVAGLMLTFVGAWFLAGRALVPIQRAFRRQQEFVADASHELRTPLTVLRSATDILEQHRDRPLAANGELFDDVRTEIARIQRLTGDLLTLARSDHGELDLAVAELDLGDLAADVTRRAMPLAAERGVTLSWQPGAAAGPTVEADPDRLQQVLLILLDNAIKYTPAGGEVTASARTQDGYGVLEVADNGPGIAAEHLSRIFERLYRADVVRGREQGGTGLGLAIAKSLVNAHGGQLVLESRPGFGTRALVRLPLAARSVSLAARLGGLAARITHGSAR